MVVHAFCVNEFSVWRMLWYLLLGRRVRILAVFAIYTAFDRPLRWLVDRLTAKGRIARLGDDIEALAPLQDDPARALLSDYFNRIEPWLENYFGFGDPDPGHSGYHRAFQHLTCNYIALQAVQIVAPSIAAARSPETQVRFYGYPRDIAAAACAFAGRDALPQITTMRPPDRLLNLLFSLALAAYSAAWLTVRVRASLAPPARISMAYDYLDDPTQAALYRELAGLGPFLLVPRNKPLAQEAEQLDLPPHNRRTITEGRFGFLDAIKCFGEAGRDWRQIRRRYGSCSARHFREVAGLVYRRLEYRGLFNLYEPRVYWGRDGYSAAHIIRRQELARFGGESWGVSHSYFALSDCYPEFRYLNFDRYYVMDRSTIERSYGEKWPDSMTVVGAQPFRMSPALTRESHCPKPPDILILSSVSIWSPAFVRAAREIAEAFSDRTVRVQVKHNRQHLDACREFLDAVTKGLDHTEIVTERSPYALFPQSRYTVSDPSTAAVESIVSGCYGFVLNVEEAQLTNPLRHLDGVCVTSGPEAVSRIKAIENGEWEYPSKAIAEHLDMSGTAFPDVIRRDFGLPPAGLEARRS
ncbi:MAG: hypothetical protein OXH94_12975 [Rhodospirillales bacterium]|nr:hypothetical protein [Rhodospirillales bacterium]